MKKNDQLILVTGGAGYVGAVLVEKLVNSGKKVSLFDRFFFGKDPVEHLKNKVEFVKGDIRQIPAKLLEGVTAVIHLAALSNDPTADFAPEANFQINTQATKDLAKLAKAAGVKRFIFASSCSVYDKGIEAADRIRDENSEVAPKTVYSSSKHKAEKELLKLSDNKFCVVILRTGTVYGYSPRMRYDLVANSMVRDALSLGRIKVYCGGIQWRPLVDVEDAAKAYIVALEAPAESVGGEIFNITFDNFQIKDLAKITQETLNKYFSIKAEIIFDQVDRKDRSYRVADGKAKKILKFSPQISPQQSILKMVKNIKKRRLTDFDNPVYYNIDWMKPVLAKEI